MPKAAVILLAGTETHADLGRATNALETVEQFRALEPQARTAAPAPQPSEGKECDADDGYHPIGEAARRRLLALRRRAA